MTESINFVLKTRQINTSLTAADYYNTTIDNNVGTISNNFCNLVWKNVNLKNLVGEYLWNNYESYNIQLCSITQGVKGITAFSASNSLAQIKMSGINWISSYDQSTKMNSGIINLATVKFLNTASVGDCVLLNGSPQYTFLKSDNVININIQLHELSTNDFINYTSSNMLPLHYIFQFSITPCKPINKHNLTNENKPPIHVVKYPFN